jgi:hypothetical protein
LGLFGSPSLEVGNYCFCAHFYVLSKSQETEETVATFLTGNQERRDIWRRLSFGDRSSFNVTNHSICADRNTEFPILSFREIAAATNHFSESSILGKGGFGNVYKV